MPWGAGLQCWEEAGLGLTEALLRPGEGNGARGEDHSRRGTARAKARRGTQHSSEGLERRTRMGRENVQGFGAQRGL